RGREAGAGRAEGCAAVQRDRGAAVVTSQAADSSASPPTYPSGALSSTSRSGDKAYWKISSLRVDTPHSAFRPAISFSSFLSDTPIFRAVAACDSPPHR